MGTPDPLAGHVLVMFDGVCNLCNGFVQFIIRRDPSGRFRFASLQSDFARRHLIHFRLDPNALHSVVVVHNGAMYQRSDAVLYIAKHLSGGWRATRVLTAVPRLIRDGVYNALARTRYRWFGRRDGCMVPDPSFKSRFLA